MSPSSPRAHNLSVAFTGRAATRLRRAVTAVVFVIAGLAFLFSLGNGYVVGVQLGVPKWMALLVAPAVDLSVVALLAAMQHLRANGVEGRLAGPRLLLVFSGTATLGLNIAHPILIGAYGQAIFYALPALLLIGWSEVGPRLLASLLGTVPGPSLVARDERPPVPPELVNRARQLDAEHRQVHGRLITRDKLRAALKVSNAVAGEVLRQVRSSPERGAQ